MRFQRRAIAFALLAVWLALSSPVLVAARVQDVVDLQRRGPPTTTTYTQEKCYTKVASTKRKHHIHTTTKYSTTTSTIAVTIKSTGSTVTVTPLPTTVTSTATASTTTTSTNLAATDTFTSFVTPTATATSTSTVTSTSTSTVSTTTATTSTSTSLLPAPAGFTPAASQVASLGYQSNQRRALDDSDPVKKQVKRQAKAPSLLARKPVIKKICKSHPQSVTCKDLVVKVVHVTTTVSSPATTTVTAQKPTATATTTTTKTVTSTVAPPDVSTTVTATAPTSTSTVTATATTTTTTTTTTTQTQTTVATATAYAACQSNNVISKISGQYVFNIYPSDSSAVINTGPANTASDCCVACQQAGCNSWEFFNADQVAYGNQCFMISDTTCPAPYEVDTDPNLAADEVGTFGNGACGQVQTIVRD